MVPFIAVRSHDSARRPLPHHPDHTSLPHTPTDRSVKESGSRRLAFCPSILRKIRYVDPNSASAASSRSGSRDASPDKQQQQQQSVAAHSSPASPLAIHVQPQSFHRQASISNTSAGHSVAANSHSNNTSSNTQTAVPQTAVPAAAASSSALSSPASRSPAATTTTGVVPVTSAGMCGMSNSSSSGSGTVAAGMVESRSITSYRDLRISFFTDDSPVHSQPPTITIRMRPDDQGRFGFNVKGGTDQKLPVLVSRVAPNSPAETAVPKLTEGDQVLQVNGTDVDQLSHDEVVSIIRCTKDTVPGGELVLLVRPNGESSATHVLFFLRLIDPSPRPELALQMIPRSFTRSLPSISVLSHFFTHPHCTHCPTLLALTFHLFLSLSSCTSTLQSHS